MDIVTKIMHELDYKQRNRIVLLRGSRAENRTLKEEPHFVNTEKEFQWVSFRHYRNLHYFFTESNLQPAYGIGKCKEFLNNVHERGGYKEALRETLRSNGYIVPIISEMTQAYIQQATREFYIGITSKYIPELNDNERIRLTRELISNFAEYLPQDFNHQNLAVLSARLENLIIMISNHMNSVKQILEV